MKKAFSLIALFVFGLFAISASAQTAGRYTGLTSLTLASNSVGATFGVTNTSARVDIPKSQSVMLNVNFKLTGAGTSDVGLFFREMADESTVLSNRVWEIRIPGNGTTPVVWGTNLTFTATPYLQLWYVTNVNANAVTNLSVKYGAKQ